MPSTRTMIKFLRCSVLVILCHIARGLDVELEGITCDETLPVTADLYMKCADGARCTFGGNSTTLYGTIYYKGVEDTGVQENVAYMSAQLMLWTLDFNLLDMYQVPLCDESMVADESNEQECPGDGAHSFSISYKLPSAGDQRASWLASGWQGSGVVRMYAEPSEDMMIGDCKLSLRTHVTQKNKSSLVGTPSASVTAYIIFASAIVLAALSCYCYCCRGKRRGKKKVENFEDQGTYFKRMEDERSYWSGAASKATKKTTATKSSQSKKSNESAASVVSELEIPNP